MDELTTTLVDVITTLGDAITTLGDAITTLDELTTTLGDVIEHTCEHRIINMCIGEYCIGRAYCLAFLRSALKRSSTIEFKYRV